jgi:hypothetical protein
MADTMMRFDDTLSSFLTKEELERKCPMAFKDTPTNPNLSQKYIHANTSTVIDDLEKLGWFPTEANQCRNTKKSSGIRIFHMIAFQNPKIKITKTNDDGDIIVDAYPRIILTNSHDGHNAFKFMLGIFRMVCSNGLVVCDDQMVNMTIRHTNYSFEELRMVVKNAIEFVPNIVNTMNEMQNISLNDEQKREIAAEVVKIRKGININDNYVVDKTVIEDILTPVRNEDKGDDLWTVFNICQEKLIKGGFFNKTQKNKMRRVKSITSIKKNMDYNQRLWLSASKYLETAK